MWEIFHQLRSWDHILQRIERKVDILMSSFDDLAAAQAETLNRVAAVKTDVETLIAALAAVPTPGLTPEQQTALDNAVKQAQAINDSLAVVDAEAHPAPPAPST